MSPPFALGPGVAGALSAARSGPAVPARVYPPVPGQSTVLPSAARARLDPVSGEGPLAGTDLGWYQYEGRSLLVSRDGRYRLVRSRHGTAAGESMLLSPDGRYLAGDNTLEGVGWQDTNWPSSI